MTDQELLYTMALTRQMTLNSQHQRILLNELGSATAVYENRRDLYRLFGQISERASMALQQMDELLPRCEMELLYARNHHIRILTIHDDEAYPQRLRTCDDAPLVLYSLGNADFNARHIISIVGTRRCTQYGRDICQQLTRDLQRLCPDVLVVSGLAYGIDIAAHRGALDAGLATIGVLAHGLDQIYPRIHRDTAIAMLHNGGLLTEFMSATQPEKMNFIQRNRIVAGMADATVVVESAEKGGSLITAEMANGYNREVFAFPGRSNDYASSGCNRLIRRNEAHLITSAEDLLATLGWETSAASYAVTASEDSQMSLFPELTADEQAIVSALQAAASDLDLSELVSRTSLPVSQIMSSLFTMEMNGIVKKLAGNTYHLCSNNR